MPRVNFNRLTKKRTSTRKRRTSTITRAKYKRRSVGANRSLIKSNAYAIRSIKRMILPAIYCDFQLQGAYAPFLDNAPVAYFNILSQPLMSPSVWVPVLRRDDNVLESNSTLLKRLSVNFRYSLGQSAWCQISHFVVTLRKNAANTVVTQNGLIANRDYILSPGDFNPRLNPEVFKVHYVRHVSLMSNTWLGREATVGTATFTSNSDATWAKGQVNLHTNFRLRNPLGGAWKDMDESALGPHRRYYLLTFFKGKTLLPDDDPPRLDYDCLASTYNAS